MIHETQVLQSKATSEEDKAALDIQMEVYNALKPQLIK